MCKHLSSAGKYFTAVALFGNLWTFRAAVALFIGNLWTFSAAVTLFIGNLWTWNAGM